jgi:hypothetical protein
LIAGSPGFERGGDINEYAVGTNGGRPTANFSTAQRVVEFRLDLGLSPSIIPVSASAEQVKQEHTGSLMVCLRSKGNSWTV